MRENPKFYLSSFSNVITAQMNPMMAIELYRFIHMHQDDVSKELFAMTEKIRTQLYHMNRLEDLERALPPTVASDSEGESGNSSGRTSQGLGIPSGEGVEVS